MPAEFEVGPYAAAREESARMPRGHRIGDQRVEDLPDFDELGRGDD